MQDIKFKSKQTNKQQKAKIAHKNKRTTKEKEQPNQTLWKQVLIKTWKR